MSSEWMVIKDGEQMGPYSFEQLIDQSRTGELEPCSLLRKTETETWSQAEQIPGLFSDATQNAASFNGEELPAPGQKSVVRTGKAKKSPLLPVLAIASGLLLLIGGSVLAFSVVAQNGAGGSEEAGEEIEGGEFQLSPFDEFDEAEQNQDEVEDESANNNDQGENSNSGGNNNSGSNNNQGGNNNSGGNNNPGDNNGDGSIVPYWHTEIHFETIPAGARIYIDDVYIGNTPHTEHLGWGIYKVTFRKDGYQEKNGSISVTNIRRLLLSTSLIEEAQEPPAQDPVAAISMNPENPQVNEAVSFSGFESRSPGGQVTNYTWEFNQGEPVSGMNVERVFDQPGTYQVRLTVTDNRGATASETLQFSVEAVEGEPTPQNPVAVIRMSPAQQGRVNEAVRFSGFYSRSPGGLIRSYTWDFCQGESESGVNIERVFDQPGTYQVRLTVTDNRGATASETLQFRITEGRFSIGPSNPRGGDNAGDEMEPIVVIIPDPDPIVVEFEDTRVSVMVKKLTVLESYQKNHVLAGFREPNDVAISCFVLSGLYDPPVEIPSNNLLYNRDFILKTGNQWSMNRILHEDVYVHPVELEIIMIAHHHTSNPSYGPYVSKGSIRIPVNRNQLDEEGSTVNRVRAVEKHFILDQRVADNSPIRARILVELVVIYTLPLPRESR